MPLAIGTRLIELNRMPPPKPLVGVAREKGAGAGSTIVTSFRVFPLLPIRVRWIARIREFEWNHHFADVQNQEPFQNWHHRHEFLAEASGATAGTIVREVIDYEVGFGFLGAIANPLLLRRQMQSAFLQRQQVLPRLLL